MREYWNAKVLTKEVPQVESTKRRTQKPGQSWEKKLVGDVDLNEKDDKNDDGDGDFDGDDDGDDDDDDGDDDDYDAI